MLRALLVLVLVSPSVFASQEVRTGPPRGVRARDAGEAVRETSLTLTVTRRDTSTVEVMQSSAVPLRLEAQSPGRQLTVRMLNPPPGLHFPPTQGVPSPVTLDFEWEVTLAGYPELLFEASDGVDTVRQSLVLDVVGGTPRDGMLVADVTGDGVLDVVAGASYARVRGEGGHGAIYVWAGGPAFDTRPSARLSIPGGKATRLGANGFLVVDVDGDGIRDVLSVSRQPAVHFWRGGPHLGAGSHLAGNVSLGTKSLSAYRMPDASLVDPAPSTSSRFANPAKGKSLRVLDLTGDGIPELLIRSAGSKVAGVDDAGAIFLWSGRGLRGSPPPAATLYLPSSVGTGLCEFGLGGLMERILIEDVTGDGVRDVVALSATPTEGSSKRGAVHVWRGGRSFDGLEPPDVNLSVLPTLTESTVSDLRLVDLTGDGELDVFAVSSGADPGGVFRAGAAFLWEGGAGLSSGAPDATLVVPGAHPSDGLGGSASCFADVTGDGLPDVLLASASLVQGGVLSAGGVHVWSGGGALAGTVAPTASLARATPVANDRLHRLDVMDYTGDGVLDVLMWSEFLDVGGVLDAGGVLVWAGGPGLALGANAPGELTIPGALPSDQLTRNNSGRPTVVVGEVTGDGQHDLVVLAPYADSPSASDIGKVLVWAGGGPIEPSPSPTAALTIPEPSSGARLGDASAGGLGVHLVDVTGEGQLDLVVPAPFSLSSQGANRGSVVVWEGGATLSGNPGPWATLVPGGATTTWMPNLSGENLFLTDADGDGNLDFISGSCNATVGSSWNAGAMFHWPGGMPGGGGVTASLSVLARGTPQINDKLGRGGGASCLLADLTGDGSLELLVSSWSLRIEGVPQAGGILVWPLSALGGGGSLPGWELAVPEAKSSDGLTNL